jgi:hypothetical protein
MALGRPSGTKKVPLIRLSSRSSTIFGTPTFARTRLATVSRALGIRGVAREPQRLGVEIERQHDGAAHACKPRYRIAHRPYS